MPTKDFQRQMAEHVRLCARAKEHAQRSVDHTEAGRIAEAKREMDRAQSYLKKAMAIERKFKLRNPHEDGQ